MQKTRQSARSNAWVMDKLGYIIIAALVVIIVGVGSISFFLQEHPFLFLDMDEVIDNVKTSVIKAGEDEGVTVLDVGVSTQSEDSKTRFLDLSVTVSDSASFETSDLVLLIEDIEATATQTFQDQVPRNAEVRAECSAIICGEDKYQIKYGDIYLDGEEIYSNDFDVVKGIDYKAMIYRWIQNRYEYCDEKEGEYTEDKYTVTIFEEAAEKFGESYDYIKRVWNNDSVAQYVWDLQ